MFLTSFHTISFSLEQSYPPWQPTVLCERSLSQVSATGDTFSEVAFEFPQTKLKLTPRIFPQPLIPRPLQFDIHEASWSLRCMI